jgi:hypothetical protein
LEHAEETNAGIIDNEVNASTFAVSTAAACCRGNTLRGRSARALCSKGEQRTSSPLQASDRLAFPWQDTDRSLEERVEAARRSIPAFV